MATQKTPKDVENKLESLKVLFRVATDWINGTGAGLDNPGDVTTYVKKLCKYSVLRYKLNLRCLLDLSFPRAVRYRWF